ncbi:2-deoxyglucose-6-phosphate phosphatase 1 [Fusarium odoratissimum]|uniref:2-deoxyglucose-6-phosphate phosphatase 1 n=2 Tax=Fusarium oxysporum species complex TaxID=171631 RepID=N1S4R9_FUSC4|nr:2-deoxyglucose-6-phosphate phosphatase 1 [Fusarium odoratissimum]TXB97111.1 hypothetical protein FocTR4_00011722 [Fusarium oxysporum f. sp. cubense]
MSSNSIEDLRRYESFQKHGLSGFLVDLNGTITDSTTAVENHWQDVCKEIGVDPKVILETSHGRRSLDVLELLAPACRRILAVAHIYLSVMAIVTSSSFSLATGWLSTFDLPSPDPERLITAESVKVDKPDPTCYFLGHKSLGSDGHDGETMLVIGDSPAGIRAGKDAGSKVLGLMTSHTYEQVKFAGPDWIVKDLESVKILGKNGDKVLVEICKHNLT